MDQMITGAFIAEMRRSKGLTQRELADIIGVSDKTVSKWERGGGLPEISLMQPLCSALDIDLNELFSGRRLSTDAFRDQANENLMALMKTAESARLNIVGARSMGETKPANAAAAAKVNAEFWNSAGNDLLGPITLPKWGSFIPDEGKLHLLGDVSGMKILEIGCGNGLSLKYLAENGAEEAWGIDISENQLRRARENLKDFPQIRLVCTPMEAMRGVPEKHFDAAISIFGLGWTDDLPAVLSRIRACLKPGGIFVFSWSHPIHKCTAWENGRLVVKNPYFDETPYAADINGAAYIMKNRTMSAYINALTTAGFTIESLVEATDPESARQTTDAFAAKALMLPTAFVIKARCV